jgi:hypothetical protein
MNFKTGYCHDGILYSEEIAEMTEPEYLIAWFKMSGLNTSVK